MGRLLLFCAALSAKKASMTSIRVQAMPFEPATTDVARQELGEAFRPRFDAAGLLTAVAVDAASGRVLMVAHMNAEALGETLRTGYAHYWSRSRNRLWKKGETSGERQRIAEVRTDCDQDALVLKVTVEGRGSACHNGYQSCFYRALDLANADPEGGRVRLVTTDTPRAYPATLYGGGD